MSELAVGVDIGGTKLHFAAVEPDGRLLLDQILPTEAALGAESVMDKVLQGISGILRRLEEKGRLPEVMGIGIGSAGQIDFHSGEVVFATDSLPGWIGTRIRDRVQERFQLPVYVDNDVNVIALAEKLFGAAQPYRSFVCLALGTGIGGAIVEEERLVRGAFGGAGELGHLSVNFNGPRCSCGNNGCVELYASGTGIARVAAEMKAEQGWKTTWTADSREVAAAWKAGDLYAAQVMSVVIQALSTGLGSIIHAFNPQAVIIGGGVSAVGDPFFRQLKEETARKTAPAMWEATTLLPAAIGTGAGVIGAAAQLWQYSSAEIK